MRQGSQGGITGGITAAPRRHDAEGKQGDLNAATGAKTTQAKDAQRRSVRSYEVEQFQSCLATPLGGLRTSRELKRR
jgi:hypothetical protein